MNIRLLSFLDDSSEHLLNVISEDIKGLRNKDATGWDLKKTSGKPPSRLNLGRVGFELEKLHL